MIVLLIGAAAVAVLAPTPAAETPISVVFTGFTNSELGMLAMFQVRNEGPVKVRRWSASAIQVGTGTNVLRPLSAGPPRDLKPGGVEVVAVQMPDVDVRWRFGVAVSPDGPRLWIADWLNSDLGWRAQPWVPAGLRTPPAVSVWSGWVGPSFHGGQ